MINAAGAVLRTVDNRPLFVVEHCGLVDSQFYKLLPGACFDHTRDKWRLPANVVPSPMRAAPKRATPSCLILRDYQSEAISLIENNRSGALVALDVGLGKSCVALAARKPGYTVICGPLRSAGAWVGPAADPAKHFGMRVAQAEGRSGGGAARDGSDACFVNYEILPWWVEAINAWRPTTIILDESHELRNAKTKAWRAAREICHPTSVKRRIALTATPVVNGVVDLWAQLDLVEPRAWGPGYVEFAVRYAGAHQGEFGWIIERETNVDELWARLDGTMLRKTRDEVRGELPKMFRVTVPVTRGALDPVCLQAYEAAYRAVSDVFRADHAQPGSKLAAINGMLQLLSQSKRPSAALAVREALLRHQNVFVACWYRETAAWLAKELKGTAEIIGPIDGKLSEAKRGKLLAALATPCAKPRVVIGTIGSTGLSRNDLVACSCGIVVDLWWVPTTLLQLEGRLDREGQKAAMVEWQYLVARETADEIMFGYLERKSAAIAATTKDFSAVTLVEVLGGKDDEKDIAAFAAELAALGGQEC